MKQILLSALLVLSVVVVYAQSTTDRVIIHIGGRVFTVNGDVDLGTLGNSQKIVEGDSTITSFPNITVITNSKTHTKEIYINGGSEDFSFGPGKTNMNLNLNQRVDSMLNNMGTWAVNMPGFSFNWNNNNYQGNMDSMMANNRKMLDSMMHQNWGQNMPQQPQYNYNYNYKWGGNNDSSQTKEKLQDKIEDLQEKLNNMQQKLNDMNEQLNTQGGKGNSAAVQEDTTRVKIGNFCIMINQNGVKVNHSDTSLHPMNNNGQASSTSKKNITTHWLLLDLGFNTYLYNMSTNLPAGYSPLELIQGKSINVNLHLFQQSINLYKQHLFFSYGVAFDFYNYRFRQNTSIIPKIDSIKFAEAPAQLSKNKLSDTYLTIPILFQYESCTNYAKSFHLGVGMNVGYLINSHTKQVSTEYGKVKVWDSYNLNSFSYGPSLRVGFSWFSLFANYSLNGLFQTGSAPLLNPFSFGISIIAD